MERSQKEALIQEYNEIFSSAVSGVLVEYQGTTVEELTKLRKDLNAQGSRFRVLKNSLAKRAAAGTPYEGLADHFVKTRAFVYSDTDAAAPKVITKAVKDNEKLKLIAGGLVTGETGVMLDAAGVEALGNLPSRDELLAKLLFLLNAPITNFARVLNEIPASFVRVLQAVADSKE